MIKSDYLKGVLALVLLGICLIVFMWPTLIKGEMYALGGLTQADYLPFNYPVREIFRQHLLAGKLPWWINNIGDGYPLVAEGEIGAFYPPNIVFFRFFPTNTAINWLLYLHALLAAFGTYLVIVKLTSSRLSAIFGGITFALSGFMITQLTEVNLLMTSSYFPLVFLIFWKQLSRPTFWHLVVLSLLFCLQILAGYVGFVYFELLILIMIGLISQGRKIRKQVLIHSLLLLSIVIGLGLAAIQVVPTIELTGFSERASGLKLGGATLFSYPKEAFLSFLGISSGFEPEYVYKSTTPPSFEIKNPLAYWSYVGILPLLFLPFGLIVVFKKRVFLPLILVAILAFLLTLGSATPLFQLFWTVIPGMKYFRHSIRFLAFVEFFLVIVASLGFWFVWSRLISSSFSKKKITVIVFAWILVGVHFADIYFHQKKINISTSPAYWLAKPEAVIAIKPYIGRGRISPTVFEKFDPNLFNNTTVQRSLRNLLPPIYSVLFDIPVNQIHIPLGITKQLAILSPSIIVEKVLVEELKQQVIQNKIDIPIPLDGKPKLLWIQGIKFVSSPIPLENPYFKLFWQFDLPRVVDLTSAVYIPEADKTLSYQVKTGHGYIYEVVDTLPRAVIIPKARVLDQRRNAIEQILADDFDPKEHVFIEGIDKTDDSGGEGNAQIIKDEGNKISIDAQTDKGGWLYLADTYYPGWKATIDGRETKIYPANYAFRAIKVPPGKHRVEFVYNPLSRKIGLVVSLLTITMLLVLITIEVKIKPGSLTRIMSLRFKN